MEETTYSRRRSEVYGEPSLSVELKVEASGPDEHRRNQHPRSGVKRSMGKRSSRAPRRSCRGAPRGNAKINLGTDERERSNTSSREEPSPGQAQADMGVSKRTGRGEEEEGVAGDKAGNEFIIPTYTCLTSSTTPPRTPRSVKHSLHLDPLPAPLCLNS
ncbi:hypothetical protein B296_00033885 [Ensete ventricosum]|uniref:Uncharacterized protein n=1 Tax=Ensete ventricosum TaxID=4639 RepID=A0A426ZD31_ENSVE|nr:hypothetical protein B296_00033885 [Ensete ventricosum]